MNFKQTMIHIKTLLASGIFKTENYLKYNFIVVITIAYALGIGLFNNKPQFLFITICLITLLIISLFAKKFFLNLFIFFIIFFFQIGFYYTNTHWFNLNYFPEKNQTSLELKITSNKKEANNKYSFTAKTKNHAKILIVFKNTAPKLPKYADLIKVSGKFYQPSTNAESFNQYLFVQGVKGIFYADNFKALKPGLANPLKIIAYALKEKIGINNEKSIPAPYSTLLTSLVFGNTDVELPKSLEDSFQKAGLIHILVVSGAQVALLTGILVTIFTALSFTNWQIFLPISLINVIFYFLTGGGASIFRAIVMVEIVLTIKLFKRNTAVLHIFCLTALIMLLLKPSDLFNLSFQFSFLATFALLYGVPKINEFWPKKWPEFLKNSLSITLAPFIFTTPIIWFYFQKVALVSLLSNLVILNLVELIVPIGFFASLIGLIIFPVQIIINNFNLLLVIIITKLTTFMAALPFAQIYITKPSLFMLIFIYFLILLSVNYFPKKNAVKAKSVLALLWLLLIGYLLVIPLLTPRNLQVTFFNVGEADAALIETPQRKNILIDLGTIKKSTFQPNLKDQLIKKGINKIDLIVISHFHLDHVGGLKDVLTNFNCKYVLDNGHVKKLEDDVFTKELADFYLALVKKKKITPLLGQTNKIYLLEPNLKLTILHAPGQHGFTENENNNSLIVKLSYFKIDFIFMGDLEKEQEEVLVNESPSLDAEVIKIGHHGSITSTSTDLLKKVHPEIAIISVGKNKFHHPGKDTLALLDSFRIKTLRTDYQGNISFLTDGKKLFCKTEAD